MAPKAAKGKAVAEEQSSAEDRQTRVRFRGSVVNMEMVDQLRWLVAGRGNEHGATVMKPVSAQPEDGDIPVFTLFLKMGLVPPLSDFTVAVMESYGIHLTQLHPNALMLLSIFAHLCEAFVGVMPSVALFRHYFIPRIDAKKPISGGVTFRLRNGLSEAFVPTVFKSKWEEWRHDWCFVHFPIFHACLADPGSAPAHDESAKALSPRDADLEVAVKRIKALREWGLTGNMVAADFLWRRLAPLQQRSHPAWAYNGAADKTRLWPGLDYNLKPDVHKKRMRELFVPDLDCVLPPTVLPLCVNDKRARILAGMPPCDAHGPTGGAGGAAPAPARSPAPKKRLETTAQREARRQDTSSRGNDPPRGSGSPRGSSSPRELGEAADDEVLPAGFQETSTGFAYVAPRAEARDAEEEEEEEDLVPLIHRKAPSASTGASPGSSQTPTVASPPREALTSPARGLALKRKTWGSASDDEE